MGEDYSQLTTRPYWVDSPEWYLEWHPFPRCWIWCRDVQPEPR